MKTAPKLTELTNNNEFVGYALSADFYSEHEWGVAKLKKKFKIDSRTMKEIVDEKSPLNPFKPNLKLQTNKKSEVLGIAKSKTGYILYTKDYSFFEPDEEIKESKIQFFEDKCLGRGAWDERNFVIFSKDKENFEKLIEAEKNNDISIGFFNFFDAGGLQIVINSKIPKEDKERILKEREASYQLYTEAKQTNIEEILKEAGKKYFALSPSYSDGKLKFWLNPYEQRTYNAGYYTVEELKQWANDEGPIIMKKISS